MNNFKKTFIVILLLSLVVAPYGYANPSCCKAKLASQDMPCHKQKPSQNEDSKCCSIGFCLKCPSQAPLFLAKTENIKSYNISKFYFSHSDTKITNFIYTPEKPPKEIS
mgnify:CR=1 FL=1